MCITIISCMFFCISCSEKYSEHINKDNTDNLYEKDSTYDTTEINNTDEKEIETDLTKVENSDKKASGEMNQYMTAISEYLKSRDNCSYSDWIMLSAPFIYYIDKSDENDIKIYCDVWKSHYIIFENRLYDKGGGLDGGICHLSKENNNYNVVDFEYAGDGTVLAKTILSYDSKVNVTLNPKLSDLFNGNVIDKSTVWRDIENLVLYKYAYENGLDCSTYVDHLQNIVSIPKIKKVKYNNYIYTDTGQILFHLTDDKGNFQIENVTDDINTCLENNASDFEKCTIKTDLGDNQIGVMIDERWHVFEK